jgi:hypothetical protein
MRAVKWILTAIATLMVLPVVTGFFVDYAKKTDAYTKPEETLGVIWATFVTPYFACAAAFAFGVAIGLWIDSGLRRFDGTRNTKRIAVGYEALGLFNKVVERQRRLMSNWPENVSDLGPEVFSTMLKIGAVGLKVPGPNVLSTPSPEIFLRYLKSVGTLLSEGHYAEAKQAANEILQDLPK